MKFTRPSVLELVIILAGVPIVSTNFTMKMIKIVPCESDEDCRLPHQYCYKHGFCANCTNCSVYHRSPGELPCVKIPQNCGSCLPGYQAEIFTGNRVKDICVQDPSQFSNGNTYWTTQNIFVYSVGSICLLFMSGIFCWKFCLKLKSQFNLESPLDMVLRKVRISSSRETRPTDQPTSNSLKNEDNPADQISKMENGDNNEDESCLLNKTESEVCHSEPEYSSEMEYTDEFVCKESDNLVQSAPCRMPSDEDIRRDATERLMNAYSSLIHNRPYRPPEQIQPESFEDLDSQENQARLSPEDGLDPPWDNDPGRHQEASHFRSPEPHFPEPYHQERLHFRSSGSRPLTSNYDEPPNRDEPPQRDSSGQGHRMNFASSSTSPNIHVAFHINSKTFVHQSN